MARKTFHIDGGFKILPGTWRNFAGEARKYNREGSRNFNIDILDDNLKNDLESAGYKVKVLLPKDEDGKPREDADPTRYMKINVNFNEYGPKIYLYSPDAPQGVLLNEETVRQLDSAEIVDCTIDINPYEYDSPMAGHGVTAYLNEMHVKVRPNEVAKRFGFGPIDISDQGSTY